MQCRIRAAFLTTAWIFFGLALGLPVAHAKGLAGAVTVPMQLELDRPYVDVTLTGPSGHRVKARAYVDTGGGGLILSAGLAKSLGLKANGNALHDEGQVLVPTAAPELSIGDKRVEPVDSRALIAATEPHVLAHTDAEMMLPGRILRHYIVVFDYPAHAFTLSDPGTFKPDGTAVKSAIGGGMPVVWVSVSGKSYGFLLDTGGQYCMISSAELGAWKKQHPAWPRIGGAYGPANMLLGDAETKLSMLRIATMQWGPFRIENVGAVSRPVGTYEKVMSDNVVGMPIIGSLGGNVLRNFKVTVDYPAQQVYLDGPAAVRDTPLDMVGVMLEPAAHGGYEVVDTAARVSGIEAGDRLLEVTGQDVAQAPFSRVVDLLRGAPGAARALLLQRGGTRVRVHAVVQTIL